MSLLLANRALISDSGEEAILVTMTPTAGFTVGFTLNFTGSIDIDFKDGGGKEALTNGLEKTHLYAAGTYIAEITGDLTNIKSEGSEVTVLGSQFQDYRDKPLEFSTGLYLLINDGYAIVSYE